MRITLTGAGFTNYDRSLAGVTLTTDAPDVVLRNISSVAAQALSCEVDVAVAYWRQFTFILSMSAQTATINKPYWVPPSGLTVSPGGATGIPYGTALTLNATGIGNGTIAAVALRTGDEPAATYPCVIDTTRTARDVLMCTPWELQEAAFNPSGLTLLVRSNDTPTAWFAPAPLTKVKIIRPALTLAGGLAALPLDAAGSRTLALFSVPGPPPLQDTRLQSMWNVSVTTTCCGTNNGTTLAPRISYTPPAGAVLGCRAPVSAAVDGVSHQLHASLGAPNTSSSMTLGPPAATTVAVAPPTVWRLSTTSSVLGYDALTQNVTLGGVVTLAGHRLASATGNVRITAMSVGDHACTTLAVDADGTTATCSWSAEVPVTELAGVDVWRGNVTADWAGGAIPLPADPMTVIPAAAMPAVRLRPAMAALVPSVVSGGTTLTVAGIGLGSRSADHVSLTVGGVECTNPVVASADVVACMVPDLIGVDIATVEGAIIADLPATAPGNVSFSTALLPEWADTPPGNDTVAIQVLLPGGRAAGATAPWPSPAPALYVRGVGSGSCQLQLSNVSTGGVAHPTYGTGLGLPPLAGGEAATAALVGTTTSPVTVPPGAPPVRVEFTNLGLLAAANTSATVTAACTDSTGVTDVEGA